MGRLITPDEVAARLGLNPRTVRAKLRKGRLKGTKRDGLWLVDEDEIWNVPTDTQSPVSCDAQDDESADVADDLPIGRIEDRFGNLENAARMLRSFYRGTSLADRISQLETLFRGSVPSSIIGMLADQQVDGELVDSALLFKMIAGQINEVIHALGILVSLPHVLEEGEAVEYLSLAAGNTGKDFDLQTNLRVAQFKFTHWRGGPEPTRKNQLFKDFYSLAEYQGTKRRCLYVLGTEFAVKSLQGRRSLKNVLSRLSIREEFRHKYGETYGVVSDYYKDHRHLVEIHDLRGSVPELRNA